MPEAVQRGQGQEEDEPASRTHWSTANVDAVDDRGDDEDRPTARVELMTRPPTAMPNRIAMMSIGAAK